ncbi:MAG: type II secretion system protein [Planctomycetia bacterium]|nr:type II secretion system protein [Planctomycetia bacterium]
MKRAKQTRAAFTLMEILVVILIIGLLAGISIVAYQGGRAMIRATLSKQQLNQIMQALEQYKLKYGEYPPDGTADEVTVKRHILKRWPKVLKAGTINLCIDKLFILDSNGNKVLAYPEQMLAFWLIGPDKNGFSADESDPFNLNGNSNISYVTPLLELSSENYDDASRTLIDRNGKWIAYFRAEKNGYWTNELDANGDPVIKKLCMPVINNDGENDDNQKHCVAVPYMKNGQWYNPDSYQLILAGDDGLFGKEEDGSYNDEHDEHEEPARDLADSSSYQSVDLDNIANFTEGATLESETE